MPLQAEVVANQGVALCLQWLAKCLCKRKLLQIKGLRSACNFAP
jgi:hypothetical protein